MKLLKTIQKRLKAKTPKFFKDIRNISLILAASSGAAALVYAGLDPSIKEAIPLDLIKQIGITSVVSTFIAQLTKEDKV